MPSPVCDQIKSACLGEPGDLEQWLTYIWHYAAFNAAFWVFWDLMQ
jgi:hypothetical protein